MPRGEDGKFTKNDGGFNINLNPFSFIKYLLIFAVVFPWYKFIEKSKILDMIDINNASCPKCECPLIVPTCPPKEACPTKCKACPTMKWPVCTCNGTKFPVCPACEECPLNCLIK